MRIFLGLVFTLLITSFSFGQMMEPVKWTMDKKEISSTEYDLVFTAEIDKTWHVYSQILESDEGPIATAFEFEDIQGYELVGSVKENGDLVEKFDDMFGMTVRYYKGSIQFTQRVKLADKDANVTGYLTFMTCNGDKCLPPTDVDFSFDL